MNFLRSTLFALWAALWTLLTAPLVILGALLLRGLWGYHFGKLWRLGIQVVSVDRDPLTPLGHDMVATGGWLRPSLWAGQPVLQVRADGAGRWVAALGKRKDKAA